MQHDQRLTASVLTKVELVAGMRSTERRAVETLFRAFEWIAVNDEVADDAGALARQYRRSHQSIDVVDYVVAATARLHEAEVWTLNVRHFPMIADLQPPY